MVKKRSGVLLWSAAKHFLHCKIRCVVHDIGRRMSYVPCHFFAKYPFVNQQVHEVSSWHILHHEVQVFHILIHTIKQLIQVHNLKSDKLTYLERVVELDNPVVVCLSQNVLLGYHMGNLRKANKIYFWKCKRALSVYNQPDFARPLCSS